MVPFQDLPFVQELEAVPSPNMVPSSRKMCHLIYPTATFLALFQAKILQLGRVEILKSSARCQGSARRASSLDGVGCGGQDPGDKRGRKAQPLEPLEPLAVWSLEFLHSLLARGKKYSMLKRPRRN